MIAITSSSKTGITLTTAAGEVFTATRVVCAVPLGVLQKKAITFTPALPATNQAAIDKLGVGLLNKVSFLEQRGVLILCHGSRPGRATHSHGTGAPFCSTRPLLTPLGQRFHCLAMGSFATLC